MKKKKYDDYSNFGDCAPFLLLNFFRWLSEILPQKFVDCWNSQQLLGCTKGPANEAWPLSIIGSIFCLWKFPAVVYFILFEKPNITMKHK